jgi:hypothetical protein
LYFSMSGLVDSGTSPKVAAITPSIAPADVHHERKIRAGAGAEPLGVQFHGWPVPTILMA